MNFESKQLINIHFEWLIDITLRIITCFSSIFFLLISRILNLQKRNQQNRIDDSLIFDMQKNLNIMSFIILSMSDVIYISRYLIDMRFYFKDLAAKRCFELMVIVNLFLSLRRCCLKLFLNERSRQDAMSKKSLWDEILKWLSS